jgi:hypothetical protein
LFVLTTDPDVATASDSPELGNCRKEFNLQNGIYRFGVTRPNVQSGPHRSTDPTSTQMVEKWPPPGWTTWNTVYTLKNTHDEPNIKRTEERSLKRRKKKLSLFWGQVSIVNHCFAFH